MNDQRMKNRIKSMPDSRRVRNATIARVAVVLGACAGLLMFNGCLGAGKKIAMTLPTLRLESRASETQQKPNSTSDHSKTNEVVENERALGNSPRNVPNVNSSLGLAQTGTSGQMEPEVGLVSYQQDREQPTHHFPAARPDQQRVNPRDLPSPLQPHYRFSDPRLPQPQAYPNYRSNSRATYSSQPQRNVSSSRLMTGMESNSHYQANSQRRMGTEENLSDQQNQAPPLPLPLPLRYQPREEALIGAADQYVMDSTQSNSQYGQSYGSQSGQSYGTGHLSSGMNLSGTRLRQHGVSATERAKQILDSNERLQEKIKALELAQKNTDAELKRRTGLLGESNAEIKKSNQMNSTLRRMVARLRIQNEDLEEEKTAIAEKADQSLSEIEETLDSVLMDSLSGTRTKLRESRQ